MKWSACLHVDIERLRSRRVASADTTVDNGADKAGYVALRHRRCGSFSRRIILRRVKDAMYLAREHFSTHLPWVLIGLAADSLASNVAINNETRTIDKRDLFQYLSTCTPSCELSGVHVAYPNNYDTFRISTTALLDKFNDTKQI